MPYKGGTNINNCKWVGVKNKHTYIEGDCGGVLPPDPELNFKSGLYNGFTTCHQTQLCETFDEHSSLSIGFWVYVADGWDSVNTPSITFFDHKKLGCAGAGGQALPDGGESEPTPNPNNCVGKTHIAVGTVFGAYEDGFAWYCDPANGVSNLAMDDVFWETNDPEVHGWCTEGPTYCCQTPNWTPADPHYYLGMDGFGMCLEDTSFSDSCASLTLLPGTYANAFVTLQYISTPANGLVNTILGTLKYIDTGLPVGYSECTVGGDPVKTFSGVHALQIHDGSNNPLPGMPTIYYTSWGLALADLIVAGYATAGMTYNDVISYPPFSSTTGTMGILLGPCICTTTDTCSSETLLPGTYVNRFYAIQYMSDPVNGLVASLFQDFKYVDLSSTIYSNSCLLGSNPIYKFSIYPLSIRDGNTSGILPGMPTITYYSWATALADLITAGYAVAGDTYDDVLLNANFIAANGTTGSGGQACYCTGSACSCCDELPSCLSNAPVPWWHDGIGTPFPGESWDEILQDAIGELIPGVTVNTTLPQFQALILTYYSDPLITGNNITFCINYDVCICCESSRIRIGANSAGSGIDFEVHNYGGSANYPIAVNHVLSGGNIIPDTWHYIACTFRNYDPGAGGQGFMDIYQDGVAVASYSNTTIFEILEGGTGCNASLTTIMGEGTTHTLYPGSIQNCTNGNMDSLAIWVEPLGGSTGVIDAPNALEIFAGGGPSINLLTDGGNYDVSAQLTHYYQFENTWNDTKGLGQPLWPIPRKGCPIPEFNCNVCPSPTIGCNFTQLASLESDGAVMTSYLSGQPNFNFTTYASNPGICNSANIPPNTLPGFSISFWIYKPAATGNPGPNFVWWQQNDFGAFPINASSFNIYVENDFMEWTAACGGLGKSVSLTSNTVISDDTWTFFVFTYSTTIGVDGTFSMYQDGVQVATDTNANHDGFFVGDWTLSPAADVFLLSFASGPFNFGGNLKHLALHNIPLDTLASVNPGVAPNTIVDMYNGGCPIDLRYTLTDYVQGNWLRNYYQFENTYTDTTLEGGAFTPAGGISFSANVPCGGGPANPFTFTVDTTNSGSAADTFVIPLVLDGVISIDVDWGDATTSTITTWNVGVSHTYAAPGTYTIQMSDTIRGFKFENAGDKDKILDISNWGDMNVTQPETFEGCANLTCSAVDSPAINTTTLQRMFAGCVIFDGVVDGWNVSGVSVFRMMFTGCTSFSQTLNSWDTSSATNMDSMFNGCTVFNQTLNLWDVSNVTDMAQMFTASFINNSSLNNWDTSNVTTMMSMFQITPFNGDIGSWNTGNVLNFSNMFGSNSAFDQDIGSWNTSSATNMSMMFTHASIFNQDIGGWDTSSVTTMVNMFKAANLFDQDLGSWDVGNVTDCTDFLDSVTLSTVNYDSLLLGWDAQALQAGVPFHGGNSIYTNCGVVEIARDNMITTDTWTITDGGGVPVACPTPFVFSVDTTNAGSAADTFVLPLVLDGVINMVVDWGDATTDNITVWNQADVTHVYAASGTYTISITGTIRGWQFGGGGDKDKILNISYWGDFDFTIKDAFKRCTNLTSTATDTPAVNLTDFAFMFESCSSFNPPNIHLWDMAAVTRINWMFFGCTAFDQPIGSWNTANVYEISYMLYNCTSFDQDLSAWNVASVTNYGGFLTNGTLSTVNYDALLIGWDAQAVSAGEAPDFGNSIFTNCTGAAFTARENLINSDGWTITDGGGVPASCPTPFTFTVDTTNAGSAADTFVLPLVSDGVISFEVDWGDATIDVITLWNQAEVTHVYAASGTYTIEITGTIRGFKFNNGGDKDKILDISEWGDMNITQSNTFQGCANLTASATDAPTIGTTDLSYTFWNAPNFNGVCDGWNVSSVTNMGGVFGYSAFNQPLSSWNTAAATSMTQMFGGLTTFDQDISAWNVAAVTNMGSMFSGCTVFNQNISSWNTGSVTSMSSMFRTCTAFDQPIGSWNVSSVSNLSQTFFGCTVFDQDLSSWNTGSLTTAWGTFYNATSFDQDISAWDVTGLTDATSFFSGVTLSTANYDALLIGWDAQVLQAGTVFDGGNSVYSCGTAEAARANMIASDTWTITDGGSTPSPCPSPFTFEVDTTQPGSAADTFVVPLVSNGAIDLVIDWGDATSDVIVVWNDANLTHVYAAGGTYTIRITATTGTLRGWTFGWAGDRQKMTEISQWGDFNWTNGSAFTQCINMVNTATDLLNITGNSMQYGFYGCSLWNPANAPLWDVSTVTNLNSMFIFNYLFNQDLDGWDVSNVYDFGGIFYGTAFNYPLPNWDVSSGTSFNQMFFDCSALNQDFDMWDMSSAASIYAMFYNCIALNQDFNSWDVSNVTNMQSVFTGCTVFDGDVTSWDVSSCTNFASTFQECTAFNQDITGWNVSAGTNFSYMFRSATSFNQNISGWNVGNATNLNSMFFYANTFNQAIGVWNTANVTDMRSVFRNNAAFDQDLSAWNIGIVAQLDAFMQGTTLSTANYDALLVGWEGQPVVSGLTVDFGGSKYTGGGAAATARADLIAAPNLWTITDGGIA